MSPRRSRRAPVRGAGVTVWLACSPRLERVILDLMVDAVQRAWSCWNAEESSAQVENQNGDLTGDRRKATRCVM
jgi:hypothetical protein